MYVKCCSKAVIQITVPHFENPIALSQERQLQYHWARCLVDAKWGGGFRESSWRRINELSHTGRISEGYLTSLPTDGHDHSTHPCPSPAPNREDKAVPKHAPLSTCCFLLPSDGTMVSF